MRLPCFFGSLGMGVIAIVIALLIGRFSRLTFRLFRGPKS